MVNDGADRIVSGLRDARSHGGVALLPYITGGYPDAEGMKALLLSLDASGAACIEIGFAFSDSIADGPVIEESFFDVLRQGVGVAAVLDMVGSLKGRIRTPLVAMVSMSIIRRWGVQAFVGTCADAGFSGMIVPDLPFEQSEETGSAARSAGIAQVLMVGPGTDDSRGTAIANASQGFIYLVGARGTTGERSAISETVRAQVTRLRAVARCPICVGFGISERRQVAEVCSFSDGAIVGSALIRRLREWRARGADAQMLADRSAGFVRSLLTDDNVRTA